MLLSQSHLSFPSDQDGSEARLELSMDNRSPALSDRLRHLQRLLRANKEGEVASELHLSALMDMVDI